MQSQLCIASSPDLPTQHQLRQAMLANTIPSLVLAYKKHIIISISCRLLNEGDTSSILSPESMRHFPAFAASPRWRQQYHPFLVSWPRHIIHNLLLLYNFSLTPDRYCIIDFAAYKSPSLFFWTHNHDAKFTKTSCTFSSLNSALLNHAEMIKMRHC